MAAIAAGGPSPRYQHEELRHQAAATQQQVGEPLRLDIPGAQGREVLLVPVLEAGGRSPPFTCLGARAAGGS
jgi:hypothetical protein